MLVFTVNDVRLCFFLSKYTLISYINSFQHFLGLPSAQQHTHRVGDDASHLDRKDLVQKVRHTGVLMESEAHGGEGAGHWSLS